MSTHSGNYKFSYDNCAHETNIRSNIATHMLNHTGEILFGCDICDYEARLKSQLDNHMSTHSGKYKFYCDNCAYKTNNKVDLANHMLIHTGAIAYACNDYKTRWKHHLMSTHSGKYRFSCDNCDFKCSMKPFLAKHMLIHT